MCSMVIVFSGMPEAGAVMMKPNTKKPPPMSTEDDGYRPENDPLPEWLLLPDGVSDQNLTFSGNQKSLTIRESGKDRWVILSQKDGASITYTRYENNKRVFVLKTNKSYSKVVPYTLKGSKLQKAKAINADDYFDTAKQISLIEDKGNIIFRKASAAARYDDPSGSVNKKRIGRHITKRQLNKLNHKVGFEGRDAAVANRVAWYESGGGDTKAVACENGTRTGFNPPYGGSKGVDYCKRHNGTAGRGLYQISNQFHAKSCNNNCAFSPTKNAKFAYKLRKKYGWTQWCAYGGCGSNDPNPAGGGPAMKCAGGRNCY